jgi:hypothetical protein
MKILLRNLLPTQQSVDLGEFDDGMVRPLLAIAGTDGDTIDIGSRVDPWDLNTFAIVRAMVVPSGSTAVITTVPGGYSVIGSPPGVLEVTFIATPDDLVFLFLAASGSGITAAQHEQLRQLIHFIDEGPGHGFVSGAAKVVTGGLFPTDVTWWDSDPGINPGAKKIVQKTINRSFPASVVLPTPIDWYMYDATGALVQHIQDNIVYTGIAETKRVRTIF